MSVDILVNQLDEHNQSSILVAKKFKPKEVLFIYDKKDEDLMNSLQDYYLKYEPLVIFERRCISEGNIEELEKVININKNKDILINLTGGSRINSLILLDICNKNSLESIYVDIRKKILYKIGNEIELLKEEFDDMNLDSLIKSAGGKLISDSTRLCDKEELIYLTKKIYKNLNLWHKYKQKLYDMNIFVHDYQDSEKVIIKKENLNREEIQLLNKILSELKKLNGIDYLEIDKNQIEVNFKNEYLKSFIFKSGTWLEIATDIIIREIKEMDEVKSGVMFFWNDKSKIVRNEVDVVAVKDSIPICISCKDSDKYNEDALNELDVYSKQIGGDKAYKILVATKNPIKSAVIERAKEMDIDIVIFDGDEEKFKDKIQKIIRRN
ncbi:Card1-like endonuclease domain-containing protein [Clostridium sp. MB05]